VFAGFDADAFLRMLAAIDGLPGCLFVTCPDVVGDADATLEQWRAWRPVLAGFPVAFVLQDGITSADVPWAELAAVFVGGSTGFKLGDDAAALCREARARGAHVHMGRVNSHRRIAYARALGCDSIDGTKWARWSDAWLAEGLRSTRQPPQLRLDVA
jgi:hypothetical protein